jgi:hypothetical protein
VGTQHAKHVVEGASKGLLQVSFRRQEVIMYILAMSAAESGLFSGSLSERKHGVMVISVKVLLLSRQGDQDRVGVRCAGRRSSACGPWGKYVLMRSSPSWTHARNKPPVRVRWGISHAKPSFPQVEGRGADAIVARIRSNCNLSASALLHAPWQERFKWLHLLA